MPRYVQGVLCSDTGRDISRLLNAAADQYGFDADAFLAGAIAESGLKEHAFRQGVWPDVSPGLFQTAIKWLDPNDGPAGLTRSDGRTVDDTPQNRQLARDWAWDAVNQIAYAAPRFKANLARANGDVLLAWCYWNAPNLDWSNPDAQHAANRENYRRSIADAAGYVAGADPIPTMAYPPVDIRGTLPWHPEFGDYEVRPLAKVIGVTIHYTAGPATQSPADIATYQTSWSAAGQTGTGYPFPGIAYHLLIGGSGTVYLCNGLDRRVWHSAAPSRNDQNVGICFTGTGNPSDAQMTGLARAIIWAEAVLGRQLTVEGHKDGYPTQCPGPGWPGWKLPLLARIEREMGGAAPPDVTNGHTIGSGFVDFLTAHPEAGLPRMNEQWFPDQTGTYVWLTPTTTYPHGCLLVWRKWTNSVRLVSFE